MKTTEYFEATRTRPDRAVIRERWIIRAVLHPEYEKRKADGRIRRWARIDDAGGRWLRVVVLADGETVHNAFLRSKVRAVKIKYFQQTDTLYIEFRPALVVETRDFDENTQIDLDSSGNMCALTVEHASRRVDLPGIDFEQVAA